MSDPSFAGAYNLPDGRVPVVDGVAHWPWDEPVARERLARVLALLELDPTGNESMLDGATNDTWLLGERVLRVCWRGDLDRPLREAALLAALPEQIPVPRPLACGRDAGLSWLLMPRLPGISLADAWPIATPARQRDYVRQLAELARTLHAWQPPGPVRSMIETAVPDDALAITGKRLIPLARQQQLRLIEYVRTLPFVPGELLDAVAGRLPDDLPAGPDVLCHGDLTPGNVLVHEGRIGAVLDWEWSWFGPPSTELTLPLWWARCTGHGEFADWLVEECPELAATPAQRWTYLAAFALRCVVHWPPDRPERELYPDHPLLLLRDLLSE